MYLKRHAQSSMLSSCPLAIWRKSYSSNLCSKYMHQKLFCRAQNAKFSLPWEGDPSQTLPPLGRFAHSQFSSQITFGWFRRHGINLLSYMSKISIWYFLIHDELLENCYEKIVIKVFKIRLILHYRASRIPELPRPVDPGRKGLCARDVRFAHIHYFQGVWKFSPPPPLQKSFLRP